MSVRKKNNKNSVATSVEEIKIIDFKNLIWQKKFIIKSRGRGTLEIDITQQTTEKGRLHFLLVVYNVKDFKD